MDESQRDATALDTSIERLSESIASQTRQLSHALVCLSHAVRPADTAGRAEFDQRLRSLGTALGSSLASQGQDHILLDSLLEAMQK